MEIDKKIAVIKSILPENVTLIAVTKTRSVEEIKEAYNYGVRDFGENKVQELLSKYDSFGHDVRWHLIGSLQRNKVKYITGKVFLIHSLDNINLLNEIEKQYSKINDTAKVLIEVNIGREASKAGVLEEDLELLVEEVEKCSFVKVKGLMAIIPKGDEETCREYFRKVRRLWCQFKNRQYRNISMEYLSMGMTADYTYAVEEGSNMVRIGEGIFGKRDYNND
jgi:PLP dependent protein